MNTIRSTWLGWGMLCVAGGGAYYFAKRSINADRAARHGDVMKKQARLQKMEPFSTEPPSHPKPKSKSSTTANDKYRVADHAGNSSSEASEEVAPVGHAPATPDQRVTEKSKYEAAEPYRSKKGDRFS